MMHRNSLNISLLGLLAIFSLGCKSSQNQNVGEKGFNSIFNGKDLDGWKGDPVYWRVDEGNLVGEITAETLLKSNSFIVWQGGEPSDFEFKCEFKITEKGNSGINYRSVVFPEIPNALKGYQADIDGAIRYTGQNYEERGRATLAYRGEISSINSQSGNWDHKKLRDKVVKNNWSEREVIGSLGTTDELKEKIKSEDWNEVQIIAKGNRLLHYVNGVLMSDVTDNDNINGKSNGLLGVQVHVGPPMKVAYRNLRLKNL
ncbi:MAG: hypothetical protein ACI9IP_002355 [Arcticibacterium sp.]|jgi:hypothetical protein